MRPGRIGSLVGVALGGWLVFAVVIGALALAVGSAWALLTWSLRPLDALASGGALATVAVGALALDVIWLLDRRRNGGRALWDRR